MIKTVDIPVELELEINELIERKCSEAGERVLDFSKLTRMALRNEIRRIKSKEEVSNG